MASAVALSRFQFQLVGRKEPNASASFFGLHGIVFESQRNCFSIHVDALVFERGIFGLKGLHSSTPVSFWAAGISAGLW